jgi:hypothetical protein
METELIEQIKKILIPLEIEYNKARAKYNKGYLNEKQLDRGADVEGWVADLNAYIDILEKGQKLNIPQAYRLNKILEKNTK